MRRYRWLHKPEDDLPGFLLVQIGNVAFTVMVEKTPTGWKLIQSDGTQEEVPWLPGDGPDDDLPPAA
jgi:hypothetical protein